MNENYLIKTHFEQRQCVTVTSYDIVTVLMIYLKSSPTRKSTKNHLTKSAAKSKIKWRLNSMSMIEKINNHLQKIGSNFRTEDGFTICMHIGNLTFLKRTFKTQEECLQFVLNCK